jgi:hypothetical protein
MSVNINEFVFRDDSYEKLCKTACHELVCSLLWVMKITGESLNMFVSEQLILAHYWNRQYYLHDHNIYFRQSEKEFQGRITLGTNCEYFHKCGFLYDLYKMFHIEEFVSIVLTTESERYCCRLFTKNNRFVFINYLLNNMPIIKHFLGTLIKEIEPRLRKYPTIDMAMLQRRQEELYVSR